MLQDTADAKRVAGRPRCTQTHNCILEAAADLLEREPYRNISIDRIAAEAKVQSTTPDRIALPGAETHQVAV